MVVRAGPLVELAVEKKGFMSRFYVKPEDVTGDEILVSREEAHHIIDVMRLSSGDEIVAFDGTGKEYIGRILNASRGCVKIKIEKINEVKPQDKISITLAQALPKKTKMDFIIEKATELGVDKIIPLATERTIVRLRGEKGPQKNQRWQNVAISASKQCGRPDIPKINPAAKFNDILKEVKHYDLAMMACLNDEAKPLREVISGFNGKKILVMVGPEGDFTPREINSAKIAGVKLISLGRLVLRVETAGLFILSVLSAFANE